MFPNVLDGAFVYFYTQKGNYGSVFYDNGKIEYIYYLAICSYNNQYYLFHCNDKFEVIADYLFDSIEECKSIASKNKKDKVFSQ
ncbi:hypothetical protein [Fusobacterium animalis]|uniref:hypothetical protein n=1 Tax=Fusobacterium animalis TaxID=76859 RepID=UPI0030CDD810